ncbi:MAG: aminotransferase class V-fold PLP-dependent enzyme [Gemmatimonadaceae bacterium]|nr:aminotransferase class V-fold PLP-dependent enzyme [Gemmatimonadaceae bacterium]
MTTRRDFLHGALGALAVPVLPGFRADAVRQLERATERGGLPDGPGDPADESYWAEVRRAFDLDDTLVNLNNGGVCPAPMPVLEAMIRDLRFSNVLPVEHMWRLLQPRMESVRRELAREFGCDTEEIAVVRNASEAMETLILGLDLRRGDEVVVTTQNYPRMLTAWDQRVRRDGIVLRRVTFPVPPRDPRLIADRVMAAVTPATKAVELPHITNLTGQIVPVAEIVRRARERGIPVFIDGAHAFAHFPFTRDALGCDFYGTSLHKWLLAPIGTGFLHVRRERIASLWPLMAAPKEGGAAPLAARPVGAGAGGEQRSRDDPHAARRSGAGRRDRLLLGGRHGPREARRLAAREVPDRLHADRDAGRGRRDPRDAERLHRGARVRPVRGGGHGGNAARDRVTRRRRATSPVRRRARSRAPGSRAPAAHRSRRRRR